MSISITSHNWLVTHFQAPTATTVASIVLLACERYTEYLSPQVSKLCGDGYPAEIVCSSGGISRQGGREDRPDKAADDAQLK